MRIRLALLAALSVTALAAGCGGDDAEPGAEAGAASDTGMQHVHGLGVNPADGDLYVATHSGLWRARAGGRSAARVGDARYDLMGFTVVGPDSFLASGHPDAGSDLPPQLGLQRSTDGGRAWQTVSLLGEVDLHVLRAAGRRIYGVDSGPAGLLTSADAGRSWQQHAPPAAVFDLAIDPDDPERVVAATERGLFASTDTGRTWRPLRDDLAGLLAWPSARRLYLVDGAGTVSRSEDRGQTFTRVGTIDSPPEAFAANGARELYAAVHGGEVLASGDGGATWRTRVRP